MFQRASVAFGRLCCGGLLLAALGCSRSAVVVTPETASQAEEPAAPAVVRARAAEPAAAPFAFPDDAGGVLLAKVLPPREPQAPEAERPAPSRSGSASLRMNPPTPPLPPSRTDLPRLSLTLTPPPLRPRLVFDETLGGLPTNLVLPAAPSLPDAGRTRVPSRDVNEPPALPILSQPVSDRAALDDPTAEASTAAAIAAPMPSRTTKAPFLKLMLPDPYDHRRPQTIPLPAEQAEPPLGTPQPPRP